jgi:hypothetical protein
MQRRRFVERAALIGAAWRSGIPAALAGEDDAGPVDAGGPLLGAGPVQPIDARYERAALHVMLALHGHPDYEAIEAMVGPPLDGRREARVILTRHDGTQVDHVTDARLPDDAVGLQRRVVHRPIEVAAGPDEPVPRAVLRFRSWRDEPVVLEVAALGAPDPARGGLVDPGRHAARSSFPVMLRERSTLAAPGSGVSIGGRAVELATLGANGSGPIRGYVSLGYHLLVLRAGERTLDVVAEPQSMRVGEAWRIDDGRGARRYAIESVGGRGGLLLACGGDRGERVVLRTDARGLRLATLHLADRHDPSRSAGLRFADDGTFAIDIGDARDLVAGRWSQDRPGRLRLAPERPGWAAARPVEIEVRTAGARTVVTTRMA